MVILIWAASAKKMSLMHKLTVKTNTRNDILKAVKSIIMIACMILFWNLNDFKLIDCLCNLEYNC